MNFRNEVHRFNFKQRIISEQRGFYRGKSNSTNLLLFSTFVDDVLESNQSVNDTYTDLSKAFDRVNIDRFI